MKYKITELKIDSLIPDDLNANKGTEFGQHLIEKSISEFGLARGIWTDKNLKVGGGNKTLENAIALGFENVIVVPTDGKTLVVTQRTDIDSSTAAGEKVFRELAIADNATGKANLDWDDEVIQQLHDQWDINPEDWGIKEFSEQSTNSDPFADKGIEAKNQYGVIVSCETEAEQEQAYKSLSELGYNCKVVVV